MQSHLDWKLKRGLGVNQSEVPMSPRSYLASAAVAWHGSALRAVLWEKLVVITENATSKDKGNQRAADKLPRGQAPWGTWEVGNHICESGFLLPRGYEFASGAHHPNLHPPVWDVHARERASITVLLGGALQLWIINSPSYYLSEMCLKREENWV